MLGDDFEAPIASVAGFSLKCLPLLHGSYFVEIHIVLSCMDRDKCPNIANHFRYAGSGCHTVHLQPQKYKNSKFQFRNLLQMSCIILVTA